MSAQPTEGLDGSVRMATARSAAWQPVAEQLLGLPEHGSADERQRRLLQAGARPVLAGDQLVWSLPPEGEPVHHLRASPRAA